MTRFFYRKSLCLVFVCLFVYLFFKLANMEPELKSSTEYYTTRFLSQIPDFSGFLKY